MDEEQRGQGALARVYQCVRFFFPPAPLAALIAQSQSQNPLSLAHTRTTDMKKKSRTSILAR
jgi:hypothetical protein